MKIEPAKPPQSRIPVSPQIAVRVAIMGTIALVVFGIIFFRLWYLQVLTGSHYTQALTAQKTRPLPVAAPRGQILASGGQVLVSTKTADAVQVVPSELPPGIHGQLEAYEARLEANEKRGLARVRRFKRRFGASESQLGRALRERLHALKLRARFPSAKVPPLPASNRGLHALFDRLGRMLGISSRTIDERVVQQFYQARYAPVTIDSSAGAGARTVLAERKNEFPGVEQGPVAARAYPYGEMAAQVFGNVGQVTEEELESPAFKGVTQGTIVGQSGLEAEYDKYLRGKPGKKRVEVNAAGEPLPSHLSAVPPKAGYSLKLTLNLPLQKEGEKAMRKEIELANETGRPADGGAFMAIDPRNGDILATGSYPSYDPSVFTRPISQKTYEGLFGKPNETPPSSGGQPLLNRAAEGGYPTGSTFKPIVAMGALESGVITPEEAFGAGKCIDVGGREWCNAGDAEYGDVDLVHALEVSSDTYFYTVGERANSYGPVIQRMAHKLGIGDPTGIDLPNDLVGTVPDAAWLRKLNALEAKCTREEHKPCYFVSEPGHQWSVGDNMNLAVGQGDLLTDPLEMAVAYSTLVNAYRNDGHGWRPTPHLGAEIENSEGELVQSLAFRSAKSNVDLNPAYLDDVFEGLHDATTGSGGTSTEDWAGWDQAQYPTYGKTGTAERLGQYEQAWYMCYVASPTRPIVIAVTIEQGGFGAEAAAPVARLIAAKWFHQPLTLTTGKSNDH